MLIAEDRLQAYGYVGDGSGKTLASRFASLAAARAIYPHAVALTDTLDWAALQGIINDNATANGIQIDLPAGAGIINEPIVSGSTTLEIDGKGRDATRLLVGTKGMDLFQHGLTKVIYGARFILRHIGLYATASGPRYAINIRQDTNSGGFILQDVIIASYSANFSWFGYVNGVGTTNTNWRDVVMTGGEYNSADKQAGMTAVGVTFTSNNNEDRSVVYNLDNVQVGAVQTAFKFIVGGTKPQEHGSIEGVQFSRSGGRTDTGPWFELYSPGAVQTGWYPPYYIFQNCNMEGPGTLIRADAISEFHIDDNLQYIDPSSKDSIKANFIDIRRGLHGTITNNTIAALPGAHLLNFVHIGEGSDAIIIKDNVFDIQSNSVEATSGIRNEATNLNIRTAGNIYEGPYTNSFANPSPWPVNMPREINLSSVRNGNYFESESRRSDIRDEQSRIRLTTPRSSTSECMPGDFADDTSFHYVCVAHNHWKRVALSPF